MYPYKVEKTPKITGIYTTYYKKFAPEYRFKGETHNFWELVCVTSGTVSVAADSNIFMLCAGQAVLHPPMQFHNINGAGDTPAEVSVFTFSGENIPDYKNKVCTISEITDIAAAYRSAQRCFNIRDGLVIVSTKSDDNAYFEYVKRLELLLTELRPSSRIGKPESSKALNYSKIVQVMNENKCRRLSVGELAQLCNMSEIGLQKAFSYYAGMGVMTYFNQLKMRDAVKMLRNGATVKEASLAVGFEDQNYFSTVFKRVMGVPPSEFGKREYV